MNTDSVNQFLERHGYIEELKLFNDKTPLTSNSKENVEAHIHIAESLSNFHPEALNDLFLEQLYMIEKKPAHVKQFVATSKKYLLSFLVSILGIILFSLLNLVYPAEVKLIGVIICTSFISYQLLKSKFFSMDVNVKNF